MQRFHQLIVLRKRPYRPGVCEKKRLEEDLCWVVPHVPPSPPTPKTQSVKRLNWTELLLGFMLGLLANLPLQRRSGDNTSTTNATLPCSAVVAAATTTKDPTFNKMCKLEMFRENKQRVTSLTFSLLFYQQNGDTSKARRRSCMQLSRQLKRVQ